MSYSHYDRLSAIDAMFLAVEDSAVHMHVGAVGIFAGGPLLDAQGTLDFDRVKATSEASLRKVPRFRQRLTYTPVTGQPMWIDDAHFNLHYHLRHTSLPSPGDDRQLKRLAGRIMSQQLDRGKPLWELWFVEGLPERRFAVITKVHHSMIDGISGIDLMSSLMRLTPDDAIERHDAWIPRPAPSPARLLADDVMRRLSAPAHALYAGYRALGAPGDTVRAARDAVVGLGEALLAGVTSASPTPLNVDIGPHRRFDWTRFDLEAVRTVKRRLGGTLNDVVLAVVTGAMRRFLRGRGLDPGTLNFRALVPVSIRSAAQHHTLGNQVSFLVAQLPVAAGTPRERLRLVSETTQVLKSSKQSLGTEVLEEISDWTLPMIFAEYARLGARSRAYNMVVTNVPGPPVPVYLLGAEMLASYPLVPLYTNQALGIALFSYNGGLFWGFNADWDAVPDLHELVEFVDGEFAQLLALAESTPEGPRCDAPIATADGPEEPSRSRSEHEAS